MPTLYSMMNETGNKNRILEMCKFRIWFLLVHYGAITSLTRYGFRHILHADQKCDRFYVCCFGNHKPEATHSLTHSCYIVLRFNVYSGGE